MFLRLLRFLRLPLVMILIFALLRFYIGVRGVPYAPRGNAMFSVVGITIISSIFFGALSGKIGGFSKVGPLLLAVTLALWSQLLIFSLTFLSYQLNLETYYTHWDSLNAPPNTIVPMAEALTRRLGAFVVFPIVCTVMAYLGRLFGLFLIDAPNTKSGGE